MGGAVDFWFNKSTSILYYRDPESNNWIPVTSDFSDHIDETINVHGIANTADLVTSGELQDEINDLSEIYLSQSSAESIYLSKNEAPTTYVVNNVGFNYGFNGISDPTYPTLTLIRGNIYIFDVSNVQISHPFALRLADGNTSNVPGTLNNNPVNGKTGQSEDTRIIYRVPFDAPNSIVYQCVFHPSMIGTIQIEDQVSSTTLSNYLTTSTASSTYLTQTNAASTYLTQTGAASTYLTQSGAGSTYLTQVSAASTYDTVEQSMTIAITDETSTISQGNTRLTMRAPFSMILTKIPRASVTTASSAGNPTVDINVNGVSILGSSKLSIDANEKTSTTAATATTLATTSIADDAEITFDIDVAGTGTRGLKVTIYYRKA